MKKELLSAFIAASTTCVSLIRADVVPEEELVRLAANDPSITEVSYRNIESTSEGIGLLCQALTNNTHVKEVCLECTNASFSMTPEGARWVVKLIKENKSIEKFVLKGHCMLWDALEAISEIFTIKSPNFKHFGLQGNMLADYGVDHFKFGFVVECWNKFTERLRKCTLEILDLSDNCIRLTEEDRGLYKKIMVSLAFMVENNENLKKLVLWKNKITGDGLTIFASNGVGESKSLKDLDFSSNKWKFEDLEEFSLCVCGVPLERLDLSGNKICSDVRCADRLKMLIGRLPNLKWINLSSNGLSEEALLELRLKYPKVEIVSDN